MPAPTTLLDHADGEVIRQETELDEARTALSTARDELRTARDDVRRASEALGSARREATQVRAALASMDTAADAGPLVDDLAGAIEDARAATADLLEARLRAAGVEARMAVAERRLSRARRRLEEARAGKAAAQEAHERRQEEWSPRLSSPPLSTLTGATGDAHDTLDSGAYGARRSALHAALPAAMRSAAEKRRALEALRLELAREVAEHARDLEDALRKDSGEPDGLAAPEATDHARARAALVDFIRAGAARHEAAAAFLEEELPELSQGEQDRIADLTADGEVAAGLEEQLTDASMEVERRRADLRKARMDALLDPSVDVSGEEAALASAESDETDRRGDFDTDGHPEALEAWEAAVPEVVWRYYLRFLRHTEALELLRDEVSPADLEAALDASEGALASARFEAAEVRARRAALADVRLEEEALRDARGEAHGERVRSALRGES